MSALHPIFAGGGGASRFPLRGREAFVSRFVLPSASLLSKLRFSNNVKRRGGKGRLKAFKKKKKPGYK